MNFKYYKISVLIPLILILTLLITPFSNWLVSEISKSENWKNIYSYVGAFSTTTILTLILYLINNFLLKSQISKPLVDLTNLNGRYDAALNSTYFDPSSRHQTLKKCVLEIKPTASYIKINSYS